MNASSAPWSSTPPLTALYRLGKTRRAACGLRDGVAPRELGIKTERMKLNAAVVSKLAAEGVPAVGVSPLGGWTTDGRQVKSHNCDAVQSLLHAGLVPVRSSRAPCTLSSSVPLLATALGLIVWASTRRTYTCCHKQTASYWRVNSTQSTHCRHRALLDSATPFPGERISPSHRRPHESLQCDHTCARLLIVINGSQLPTRTCLSRARREPPRSTRLAY